MVEIRTMLQEQDAIIYHHWNLLHSVETKTPPSLFFPFFGPVPINIGDGRRFDRFIGECRLCSLKNLLARETFGWSGDALERVWGRSSSTRCSKNNMPPPPITRSRACKRETSEFYLYLCVWANVGRYLWLVYAHRLRNNFRESFRFVRMTGNYNYPRGRV